jgi:hypothetical protein
MFLLPPLLPLLLLPLLYRWDYSHDERDNEIAELKKRLVEEQRRAKEAAAKAETDLKDVLTSLQVGCRDLRLAINVLVCFVVVVE